MRRDRPLASPRSGARSRRDAIAGGGLAAIHAVISIHLRADQILSGTAVWFLAIGLTGYLFIDIYGPEGTPGNIPAIPAVNLSFLDGVPFFGEAFGDLNLMIWVGFMLVIASYYVIFRSPWGLHLRSVGEHPRAAETVGLSVYQIRYTAVILSGVLAGLGGAFLSIGFVNSFSENMTAGIGLHRPRSADLRQLAPEGPVPGVPALRLLERHRGPPAGLLRLARRALPDPAVRPDADRGGRRRRPAAPARRHRHPLRPQLTGAQEPR